MTVINPGNKEVPSNYPWVKGVGVWVRAPAPGWVGGSCPGVGAGRRVVVAG